MNPFKRQQNERKFGSWQDLPGGGRRYWDHVPGRSGWRARYVKDVDQEEATTGFRQEVYDETGRLRDTHDKYPVDLGHRLVKGEDA